MSGEARERPFLTVVKGAPTDTELAALVAVLSAGAGSPGAATPAVVDRWGQPSDMARESWGMPSSYPHRR